MRTFTSILLLAACAAALVATSTPLVLAEDALPPRAMDRTLPGYRVYVRSGCNVCHGVGLEGSNMGPPLTAVYGHYDRETFARYLAAPDSVVRDDERLQELDKRYRMFVMPSFEFEPDELAQLTDLVLGSDD